MDGWNTKSKRIQVFDVKVEFLTGGVKRNEKSH